MAGAGFSRSATTEPIRLEGTREMEQVLKQLPEILAKRIVNNALRKGATVILREAQARAPVGVESKGRVRIYRRKSGSIRISNYGKLILNLRVMKIPQDQLSPGTSAGVAITVGDAFWGMFIEWGAPARGLTPKPFLRPAFDQTHRQALRVMALEIRKGISKTLKKLVKPRNLPRRLG